MKRNLDRLLKTVAVVFSTILVCAILPGNLAHAQGQLPPDAPLADQLKAQYKVTKFGLDGGGFTVLSPGTILVIQKGEILGVPSANLTRGVAIFKDGDLKQPSGGNRMFLGNVTRFPQVGEKVYVQKVDVNLKNDKVQLTIVECDSCNGANEPSLYKGVVSFEFAKGSLATADPAQMDSSDTTIKVSVINLNVVVTTTSRERPGCGSTQDFQIDRVVKDLNGLIAIRKMGD